MFRVCRFIFWFNFLSSAYHLFDTAIGIHKPIFPPNIDFAFHAVGLFLWGTIALYGIRELPKGDIEP